MNTHRLTRSRFALIVAAALVLAGMGAKPPLVGGPAPPFTLPDLEGKPVSLEQFHGRPVLLNFWATWCEPCKKEMPEIQSAYDTHRADGFVVLAIDFGETPEAAAKFVRKMGLTFPVLIDRKVTVASTYGIVSLPVTFLVDREGVIQERFFGGGLTAAQIDAALGKTSAGPRP